MEPIKVALVGLGWWGQKIAVTLDGNRAIPDRPGGRDQSRGGRELQRRA